MYCEYVKMCENHSEETKITSTREQQKNKKKTKAPQPRTYIHTLVSLPADPQKQHHQQPNFYT